MEHIDEPQLDMRERGADRQVSDRRLCTQLRIVTGCTDPIPLIAMPDTSQADAVLHQDACNPGASAP